MHYDLLHDLLQNVEISGLGNDLVHLVAPRFLNELLFGVAGDRYNCWLWQVILPDEVANIVSGFVTVHDRHLAVHQDQTIHKLWGVTRIRDAECILDHFERLISVKCLVNQGLYTLKSHLRQLDGQAQYVVRFVVHDEDTPLHVLQAWLVVEVVALRMDDLTDLVVSSLH